MELFSKYPFPCYIFLVVDRLVRITSTGACTPWVRAFLRLHRCQVGDDFCCDGIPQIRMQKPGSIHIGNKVTINTRRMSNLAGVTQRTILHCILDGKIHLSDGCGLSAAVLSARNRIQLGSRVNVGVNTRIFDHDFHSLNPEHRTNRRIDHANVASAPVILSDDVFVGANAIILKGVTIGARSIIAAGSVVCRGDYPEDSLIGGNPARVIKRAASQ
jgi:acetyltransferase-like isoleucine patch superfamily enzyme